MRLHPEGWLAEQDVAVNSGPLPVVRTFYRHWLRTWVRFTVRHRDQLRVEQIDAFKIVVLPGVFNGVLLRTGAFLAETLNPSMIPANARVLDLGCGSGIGAIFATRYASRVVATDLHPEAARCTQINALINHLESKIETHVGDLFAPIHGERFDVILFNPPFYRGHPHTYSDAAWRSIDVFDRFLHELPAHLTENGHALVVLSSDGDIAEALKSSQNLSRRVIRQRDLVNEILSVYEIRVAK